MRGQENQQHRRRTWTQRAAFAVLLCASLFYLYGAAVHVANMVSATGFDWPSAPRKWQVLDVVYLALDLLVAGGLWRRARASVVAFFAAAASQLVLYTAGRSWVLDVPTEYAVTGEQVGYLDTLVLFHAVTVVLVLWALRGHR